MPDRARGAARSDRPTRRIIVHFRPFAATACARWWNRRWQSRPSPPTTPTPDLPDASELGALTRRPAALFGRHPKHRHGRPHPGSARNRRGRASRPIRASPTPKARRSAPYYGRARVREFARIPGRVSDQQLLAESPRRWRARATRWSATIGIPPRAAMRKLESPAAIGRHAAERTVRRLGARKVPTQKVPVIFDPMHRALADRQHLRRRGGRFHLSQRFVSCGQTRRTRGVRKRHHHRRRNHSRASSALRPSTTKACPRGAPW